MNKYKVVLITMSPLEVLDNYLNSSKFKTELSDINGEFKIVGTMFLGKNEHGLIQYQFVLERF